MLDTHLVEISGLHKRFPGIHAVNDVSLHIDTGETYGLLGPHGAGKTTTISLVAGVLEPDDGTVTVAGNHIGPQSPHGRDTIGFVPPDLAIYPDLTAEQNLVYFGCLLGMSKRDARRRAAEVLEMIGLSGQGDARAGRCSGGMKHRLNIGIGLLHAPRLLILDEPTFGVDPDEHEAVLRTVERLPHADIAVLYSTHHLAEAERLCDRIGIMDGGRIVAECTKEELRTRSAELEPVLTRLQAQTARV